jgi:putative addiction module component (TIGR02574 family)
MTAPLETISDQALGLPPAERLSLARTLIESVEGHEDASLEAAWDAEIAERLERFQSGKSPGVPAADVFRRLREIAPGR